VVKEADGGEQDQKDKCQEEDKEEQKVLDRENEQVMVGTNIGTNTE